MKKEAAQIGAAARAFTVLEVILKNGPIKPAKICEMTQLGRSAVHRSIHLLVEQGWVRTQLGDRACIATYQFDQLAADANFSQPVQDQIYPILKELCTAHYLHGDIAFLFGGGIVRLVESTDSKYDITQPLSLVNSDISTAIFSIMEREQITRLSTIAMKTMEDDEKNDIISGGLAMRIVKAREDGNMAWDYNDSYVSIPFYDKTKLYGAVRLRQKYVSKTGRQTLSYVATELHRHLPQVFKNKPVISPR
ncbi:MarR family transcriptional regulator [Amylibacter sp. SFDW26]|uniref:MarR family transcriptional regulator n=1 Tax=Amylibacter sp. SFDW26 TaxID=2652722 RepID=UPI001869A5F2|nr:MarR family transcriptional regulator [Amylibacter sp. SFDW26]